MLHQVCDIETETTTEACVIIKAKQGENVDRNIVHPSPPVNGSIPIVYDGENHFMAYEPHK